jgi:hypothetical protein
MAAKNRKPKTRGIEVARPAFDNNNLVGPGRIVICLSLMSASQIVIMNLIAPWQLVRKMSGAMVNNQLRDLRDSVFMI